MNIIIISQSTIRSILLDKNLFCATVLLIQATDFYFLSLDVRWVKMRVQNPFADIISGLMSETQELMKKIFSVGKIL